MISRLVAAAAVVMTVSCLGVGPALADSVRPDFRINEPTGGDNKLPVAVEFPTGDYMVVWQSFGDSERVSGLYARRLFRNGDKAGKEFAVFKAKGAGFEQHRVAAVGNHDFVVTWWDGNRLLGRVFDKRGKRLSKFQLAKIPESRNFERSHTIVPLGRNHFLVSWGGKGGPHGTLYARKFRKSGKPIGKAFQVTKRGVWHTATKLSNGRLVFYVFDRRKRTIFGQFINRNGSKHNKPFTVRKNVTERTGPGELSAAPLGNGSSVVVWYEDGGAVFSNDIKGYIFNKHGKKFKNEVLIENVYNQSVYPVVARLNRDKFVISYLSVVLFANYNYVAVYNRYGSPRQDPFVLNSRFPASGRSTIVGRESGGFFGAWDDRFTVAGAIYK